MSYRLPKKLENLPKYDPVTETYRVRLDANESFLEMPEEIKKENVTPKGSPALVKPMNNGIEEQEQKGVTVPSRAAMRLAQMP